MADSSENLSINYLVLKDLPLMFTISFSSIFILISGDRVFIALSTSTTPNPLFFQDNWPYHSFTGFFMKPS